MDYFEIFPADEFQAEQLDAYFSANAENWVSKLDIIHLFGKDKLEDIQKRLSKATGLAFITVDFKGEPITEATSFSRFCGKCGITRLPLNAVSPQMPLVPYRRL